MSVKICGLIECLPCSVWAWCDRPVYHPPPECPEETIADFEGYRRTPERRAWEQAQPNSASMLRGIGNDISLSRYWRRRQVFAQRQYAKWYRAQSWSKGQKPAKMGWAILGDRGHAQDMKDASEKRAEERAV